MKQGEDCNRNMVENLQDAADEMLQLRARAYS